MGYYFIVTDTKETKQNYMYGLRDSTPQSIQEKLVIKVVRSRTVDLVDKAISLAALNPQYSEVWIVFDRDQVKNFDNIISEALKEVCMSDGQILALKYGFMHTLARCQCFKHPFLVVMALRIVMKRKLNKNI